MPPLSDPSCGLPVEDNKNIAIYPARFPPGGSGDCICKKTCHGGITKPKMKYVQPPIPASYKPSSHYAKPRYNFETGTVYKLSYPGVDAETMKTLAERPRKSRDNICPSQMPLEQDTTFRLSYTGAGGERAVPYKPVYRTMAGSGPIQSVTTHRHDYTPKPIPEKPVLPLAPNNIRLSTGKMEDATTARLSYRPVEVEKTQSYKPVQVYRKPDYRFDSETVNRLSYQPWGPIPKENYPWKTRQEYRQPAYPMDGHTIYRASFLPNEGYERARPCVPAQTCASSDFPMESSTIYRESFRPNGEAVCRPERVVRTGNIFTSKAPMSQETTFRLSYHGTAGTERPAPYKPHRRTMMGSGPMQSVTTQRHDYTPKPFVPTENFKPKPATCSSEYRMEDTTTFRASYQANDRYEPTPSYKPRNVYRPSDYPMDTATVNKLSYQPWDPMPKEEIPWRKAENYRQPTGTMDGTTVYRGSYHPPGSFLSEENSSPAEENGPCLCTHKGQCRSATEDL